MPLNDAATLMSQSIGPPLVYLEGLPVAAVRAAEVVEHISCSLDRRQGGWLVTANVDFLERARRDPLTRQLYAAADMTVADGMPLIWASRLRGTPIPERIAGSDLVWRIAEWAAKTGRSLYLLGGADDSARRAAQVLSTHWPAIRIAGWSNPIISSPVASEELTPIREELRRLQPDLVYVAFGSPKQEHLIRALRNDLPRSWLLGCGISLSFVAGDVARAPGWMQRLGLEWLHRLASDPIRLFPRYVLRDLPFVFGLLWRSLWFRKQSARSEYLSASSAWRQK